MSSTTAKHRMYKYLLIVKGYSFKYYTIELKLNNYRIYGYNFKEDGVFFLPF